MDHLITNLKNNLGVDPKKAVGVKPSTDAVTAITKTNTMDQVELREKVYEGKRMEIQYHFR